MWIEGSGFNIGGYFHDPFTMGYVYELLCSHDENGKQLYMNTNYESCYINTTNINETDIEEIETIVDIYTNGGIFVERRYSESTEGLIKGIYILKADKAERKVWIR